MKNALFLILILTIAIVNGGGSSKAPALAAAPDLQLVLLGGKRVFESSC